MKFCKQSVPSFFLADVQNLFRKTFSSSFDMSSLGFKHLVLPELASHSVTFKGKKLLLLHNLHKCVKSSCSYLKFCNLVNLMSFSLLL